MCGRYNIIDDPLIRDLLDALEISVSAETRFNIAPGAKGQIVYETNQGRTLEDAIWSLLIEPKPDGSGYRPSPKYSTFNARSGSLGTSPLWKKRFHSQRAIIPASGFHEWTGQKGQKQCHNIYPVDNAIAFAGLYELWDFQGKIVPSFTIITLPPHPRFSHIHPRSLPLMLERDDFDMWLDPQMTNTDPLQHLLKTRIREPLLVEPVKSPGSLEKIGRGEVIEADQN
jgi:putative SOS response-associated peptidase YedK